MIMRRRTQSSDGYGKDFCDSPGTSTGDDHLRLPLVARRKESDESRRPQSQSFSGDSSSDFGLICGDPQSSWRKHLLSVLTLVFCVVGLALYWTSRTAMSEAYKEAASLRESARAINQKIKSAALDVQILNRKVAALEKVDEERNDAELEKRAESQKTARIASSESVGALHELEKSVMQTAQRSELLKEEVQKLSKQEAIRKYGEGVHRIQIDLEFVDGKEIPNSFVIELAPLDMMPHSVHYFLELVSEGLLEGSSFIMKALEVIKWAPLPRNGTVVSDKAALYEEKGLQSPVFHEYSPQYPHYKYTVGLEADGSPSWYINIHDNTELHVGEPCFGKIVSGFDAIERMENMPTKNGVWFQHRIGVKTATLL